MKEKDIHMKNKTRKLEHWQVVTLLLMLYDFIAVALSYCLALWVRFDCQFSRIETRYLQAYGKSIIFYALFCVVVFWFLRLYKSIWRFASYSELLRVVAATLLTGSVCIICSTIIINRNGV